MSGELASRDEQRRAWLESLPEPCRKECTIAKWVIKELAENGAPFITSRAQDCSRKPTFIGECGTVKIVCNHPGSGETTDFNEQAENLRTYFSLE